MEGVEEGHLIGWPTWRRIAGGGHQDQKTRFRHTIQIYRPPLPWMFHDLSMGWFGLSLEESGQHDDGLIQDPC